YGLHQPPPPVSPTPWLVSTCYCLYHSDSHPLLHFQTLIFLPIPLHSHHPPTSSHSAELHLLHFKFTQLSSILTCLWFSRSIPVRFCYFHTTGPTPRPQFLQN
ncbi:hypothetical protein PIB30_062402, partial [Stylosanthes scabra]|nr:hypothetical protein [Stylosanthes scabra]